MPYKLIFSHKWTVHVKRLYLRGIVEQMQPIYKHLHMGSKESKETKKKNVTRLSQVSNPYPN